MNEKKINQFVEDLKFHTLGGFTLDNAYEKFRKDQIENYESKFLSELDQAKKILDTKSVKSLNFSIVSSKNRKIGILDPKIIIRIGNVIKNTFEKSRKDQKV